MTQESSPGSSRLLTGIYCIFIVILSIVICSTYHISDDISQTTVNAYFVLLYVVGIIWLIAFKPLATPCRGNKRTFHEVRSEHKSNKWLKGILVVFGIAIVIQDVLEFLVTFEYDAKECRLPLNFVTPLLQAIYVVVEVNFLFRHSKLHLQGNRQISRFGSMHIMGTNLSMWMFIIIYESMEYYNHVIEDTADSVDESYHPPATTSAILNRTTQDDLHNYDYCECTSKFCDSVHHAEVFLYPFLIEFSLVASCMMYIVWKNVDTMPKNDNAHPQPVYRFYNSYIGFICGGIVLVATIIVLVIMKNTINHNETEQNYDSELLTLQICNSFMVLLETGMLIACISGLIFFKMDPRPVNMKVSLDVVLIMVTLTSVTALDVFYAFSVYVSMIQNNIFIWGAIYPIVDLVQCVVQTSFLLWGLSREPSLTTQSSTDGFFKSSRPSTLSARTTTTEIDENSDSENGTSFRAISDRPRNSRSDVLSPQIAIDSAEEDSGLEDGNSQSVEEINSISSQIPGSQPNIDIGRLTKISEEAVRKGSRRQQSKTRISIRNVAMFLLLSNACIWVFWSLENTTFQLFTYPYYYYTEKGHNAPNVWHSTTMFCLPLSIFFRMHSCACLFEVWSLT